MKTKINQPDLRKFNFRADNVLVCSIKPTEAANGLVKPEQYDDKPEFGTVIQVGDAVTDLKAGDTVFFGKYSTVQTRSLGQDYFLIRSEDIQAVLPQ